VSEGARRRAQLFNGIDAKTGSIPRGKQYSHTSCYAAVRGKPLLGEETTRQHDWRDETTGRVVEHSSNTTARWHTKSGRGNEQITQPKPTQFTVPSHRSNAPSMNPNNVDAHNACAFFKHLVEYQMAVCRECRHSVVPSHIESHLRHIHKVEHKVAERVAEAAREWTSLAAYASEVPVPREVMRPIA
jgi:hypothetical protein